MKTPARTMLESLGRELAPEAEQALNEALEVARRRYDIRSAAEPSRGPVVRDLEKIAKQARSLAKTLQSKHVKDRLTVKSDDGRTVLAVDLAPALEVLAQAAVTEADPIRGYVNPLDGALPMLLGRDLVKLVQTHLGLQPTFSRKKGTQEPYGPFIDAMEAAAKAIDVRTTRHTIGTYVSDGRPDEGVGSSVQNS